MTVTEDGPAFAAALRRAHADRHLRGASRASAATRKIYEERFAFAAYRNALMAIVKEAAQA